MADDDAPGVTDYVDGALKAVSVVKDIFSDSPSGTSYTTDQITYPADLDRVPDDAVQSGKSVLSIGKAGYLFNSDSILFMLDGSFRSYEQTIIDDPNSIVMPVMANVSVRLKDNQKAGLTEVDVHFTADRTPYGTPEDPRIRFTCEGSYDPAGRGDVNFSGVVEIDSQGNVTLLDHRIVGGDADITDNSPGGFGVTIPD